MEDPQAKNELDLARNLILTSNVLATQLFPDSFHTNDTGLSERIGIWRIKSPNFHYPQMSIDGYDVSGQLYGLAQRVDEQLIALNVMPPYQDEIYGYQPSGYVWEVRSAGSFPGFNCDIYVPITMKDSRDDLKNNKGYGTLSTDNLFWLDLGETFKDTSKKENILLGSIIKGSLEDNAFAIWLLNGLTKSRGVEQEHVYSID